MNRTISLIAIDGPAASGKSTVGKLLAEALNYLFLDTGCMYRATTVAVFQQNIDIMDETAVTQLAQAIDIDIQPVAGKVDGRLYTVLLDGRDITWDIRSPQVDGNVSQVSKYIGVRQQMVMLQRAFGKRGKVVMVGRDIGTVVMPNAPLKLYVTASAEERARRRWHDRQGQGHNGDNYEAILADVIRRDKIDSSREHSPLRPATDAIHIDTTNRTPAELVADILMMVQSEEQVISNQ
ncbi:MAG: (d)CMP kinase [Chloroflexi bacterium]|nr:(d)CMP kinase [Chloroflexota bacterium]